MGEMSTDELLSYRNTTIVTVDELGQDFLHPELLCLRLKDSKVRKAPIDIGSFAYLRRSSKADLKGGRGNAVDVSSLEVSRRGLVVNLLDSLVGLRDTSIRYFLYHAESILVWLNSNGYIEIFFDGRQASAAYVSYTNHLNDSVMHGKITPQYANGVQRVFQAIVKMQCPEECEYILSNAPAIPTLREPIRPPRSSDVELFKDVCLAIARNFRRFLLDRESYPCVVRIRNYEVVRFPSHQGVIGPFSNGAPCYNAEKRRIATIEEYLAHPIKQAIRPRLDAARATLKSVNANLIDANIDSRCHDRMLMAALSMKAYAALLLLITGASPAELEQFDYEEAIEVEKSVVNKQFTAIKFRANGRKTRYVIGRKEGLPLLREYLALREWILDGRECEKLFFTFPQVSAFTSMRIFPRMSATNALKSFYDSVSGTYLDPSCPNITSRKIRKYKSNVHHSAGFSPEIVANSLNHTEAINVKVYGEATIEQQEGELDKYWGAVRKAAQMVRDRNEPSSQDNVATAAGHCKLFDLPEADSSLGAVVIAPNCRQQYGCLYCVNYLCHSDEEDVHKLLSLQYVVEAVRHSASDHSHADSLYMDLSMRIKFIVDSIGGRSIELSDMVESVRVNVFELGELTPFWESRLQRYEKLGVVF